MTPAAPMEPLPLTALPATPIERLAPARRVVWRQRRRRQQPGARRHPADRGRRRSGGAFPLSTISKARLARYADTPATLQTDRREVERRRLWAVMQHA